MTGRTLVFDEVDAGVGGEAAVAVGRALADLARHHQVLVVTHLPQVAAFADHHLVVSKVVEAGRTQARVGAVAGEDRVVELSRMLSGRPDSDTARRHAAELLGLADAGPAGGPRADGSGEVALAGGKPVGGKPAGGKAAGRKPAGGKAVRAEAAAATPAGGRRPARARLRPGS